MAGIEAALVERERTGAGPPRRGLAARLRADLAAQPGLGLGVGGRAPTRRGNRHPSIAPYETYEAADRPFAVACGNDRLFARLCEAIGLPDLPADERFATNTARVAHIGELGDALEAVFTTQPAAHWVEVLRAANVPVGPINDVAEAYAMAEELGLEPILEADGVPARRRPAASARRRASGGRRRGSTSTATDIAGVELASPQCTLHGAALAARVAALLARGDRLPHRLRQHEADVLAHDLELRDVLRAAGAEEVDEARDELLGRARAGADADHALALEPLVADLALVVDQVGVGAVVARDVDEALRVGRVLEPMTSTRSHSAAICLTAAWRLVVA